MLHLLPQAVDRAAARDPEHEAVRCAGRGLGYGALATRTDRLACVLAEHGVRRGDRVGILAAKGIRSAVAIHGIMKAGGAYVPLDPTAPPERLAFILRDCGIRHLVTEAAQAPTLRLLARAEGVTLDLLVGLAPQDDLRVPTLSWDDVESAPTRAPAIGTIEQDLAYVLYTSGSTGTPKGVMHTHRSALSFAEVAAQTYGFAPADRISNHAPLHFDLSTLDYFATAVAGATTVVIPEAYTKLPASLSKLAESERLTVLYAVPLAFVHLLLHGALEKRDLSALRWVLFGGEPFPPKHLQGLMHALPDATFCNVYGPTETNGCTYHIVSGPPEPGAALPIGRPYPNVELLVVNADGDAVPPGAVGELLVRSPTMMRGYWGRPDLNERAFFHRRVYGHYDDVFHRTGDLVRQDPDGLLHFLGRKDRQVKTRGYRVELAEVEAVLTAHPSVQAAAAYTMPADDGSQRIWASVIPGEGHAGLREADVRDHAARHLPPYAVPERIGIADQFPSTSTGKIDRLALREQTMAAVSQ